MSRMNGIAIRRAVFAGVVAVACVAPAFAQQQASLGQAHPKLPDLSQSPRWHVYKLQRDGIDYLQVNDQAGEVRAVIAEANGTFLALPMGSDASRVSTPQVQMPTLSTVTPPETIFHSGPVVITAQTLGNGAALFSAQCVPAENCGLKRQPAMSAQCSSAENCGLLQIQ